MSALRGNPRAAFALAAVFVLGALLVPAASGTRASSAATPAFPLAGSINGPSVLGINAVQFYKLNGSGGPAEAANTSLVGNITFYLSLTGNNLSGTSISPTKGPLGYVNSTVTLTVSNITETITIHMMVTSTYQGANESINLTQNVQIVVPYELSATVVAGPLTVLPFPIAVYLDGTQVGTVEVPTITANSTYDLTFKYAVAPLAAGSHTFVMVIPNSERGLLSFKGGQSSYSATFYVAGPAPNYTIWIVLGFVAFGAVAFISLILVGNRRRGRGRA